MWQGAAQPVSRSHPRTIPSGERDSMWPSIMLTSQFKALKKDVLF
jgi:hypothetical protein